MSYAFISYSSKRQDCLSEIKELLSENQIDLWVAPESIPFGSKYPSQIERAIRDCSCFVLILTPQALESTYVEKELDRAVTYNKPIIPIKFGDFELSDDFKFYIGNVQTISVKSGALGSSEKKKIVEVIKMLVRGQAGYKEEPKPEPVRKPPEIVKYNPTGNYTCKAKIKVIGVGGAGNKAIHRMIEAGINCAEYVVVNTDSQLLRLSPCENKIQIGARLTKGLGGGGNPDVGRAAAEESKGILTEVIKGTDLLFITAGMGGGTGTGAAPVIAKIARDMKILTVAVVTEPFAFEGKKRMENTVKGLDNLKKYVDTLIVIPNDRIEAVVNKNTTMVEALHVADEILKQSIKCIAELTANPALINLDFADVKKILKDAGIAQLGVGVAKGDNRIIEALRMAVNCPLLQTTIEGARGVILNVVGGSDLTFSEVTDAAELVRSVVDSSANIIFGARVDEDMQDEVEITVIATGFPDKRATNNAMSAPEKPSVREEPYAPENPSVRGKEPKFARLLRNLGKRNDSD